MSGESVIVPGLEFSYFWRVGRFNELPKQNGKSLCSPIFTDSSGQIRWCLELYPNGCKVADEGALSLFLYLRSPERKVTAKRWFAVVDSTGKRCYERESNPKRHDSSQYWGWGWSQFISRQTLLNNSALLPNQHLTIYCKVEIVECELSLTQSPPVAYNLPNLIKQLGLFDVSLVVSCVEIRAHRLVLSAVSPVFRAMFEYDTLEREERRVKIVDLKPSTVRRMVDFIYGDVKLLESADLTNTEQLLDAADKYEIDSLCQAVKHRFILLLTPDTATRILVAADRHNITDLRSRVVEFIKSKPLEVITKPDWISAIKLHSDLIAQIHQSITTELASLQTKQ